MIIFYFCPRPIAPGPLLRTAVRAGFNMFPMNLMGCIENGVFPPLVSTHVDVCPFAERARRVVLSSVPVEQSSVISKLGSNHRKHVSIGINLP